MQVWFIQGWKGTVVCKEEVTHKGFKDLGLGLQMSQIEKMTITSVTDGNASTCGGEYRKQHGSEHEAEEGWSQYTALFDAIGDWEGVRHRSTFHYASHHSIMEGPDGVDKPRWTAKLEEYGP